MLKTILFVACLAQVVYRIDSDPITSEKLKHKATPDCWNDVDKKSFEPLKWVFQGENGKHFFEKKSDTVWEEVLNGNVLASYDEVSIGRTNKGLTVLLKRVDGKHVLLEPTRMCWGNDAKHILYFGANGSWTTQSRNYSTGSRCLEFTWPVKTEDGTKLREEPLPKCFPDEGDDVIKRTSNEIKWVYDFMPFRFFVKKSNEIWEERYGMRLIGTFNQVDSGRNFRGEYVVLRRKDGIYVQLDNGRKLWGYSRNFIAYFDAYGHWAIDKRLTSVEPHKNDDGTLECPVDDVALKTSTDVSDICTTTCKHNGCTWTGTFTTADGQTGPFSCRCTDVENPAKQPSRRINTVDRLVNCEPVLDDPTDRSSLDTQEVCMETCKQNGCIWTGVSTVVNGLGLSTCQCKDLKDVNLGKLGPNTDETVHCEVDPTDARDSDPKDVCHDVCKEKGLDWTGICTSVNGVGLSTCECKDLGLAGKLISRKSGDEEPCEPDQEVAERHGWNPALVCVNTCRHNGKLWDGRWDWINGRLAVCYCIV